MAEEIDRKCGETDPELHVAKAGLWSRSALIMHLYSRLGIRTVVEPQTSVDFN